LKPDIIAMAEFNVDRASERVEKLKRDLASAEDQEKYARANLAKLRQEAKSHNQHPNYEQWKSICPKCRSQHTPHHNGSREYEVTLECSDCKHVFMLKEAFEAELKRQTEWQAIVNRKAVQS